MATMDVAIVSIDGSIWSGEGTSVTGTTVNGEMGILPGRQPILAEMAEVGVVTVRTDDDDYLVFAVTGGLLSCTGDRVTIIAEHAYTAEDFSEAELRQELESLPDTATEQEKVILQAKLRAAQRLSHAQG